MFPLSVLTSSEELATVEPLIQMSSFQHRYLFKPKHLLGAASQDCSIRVLEGVAVHLVLCLDRVGGIWSLCLHLYPLWLWLTCLLLVFLAVWRTHSASVNSFSPIQAKKTPGLCELTCSCCQESQGCCQEHVVASHLCLPLLKTMWFSRVKENRAGVAHPALWAPPCWWTNGVMYALELQVAAPRGTEDSCSLESQEGLGKQ